MSLRSSCFLLTSAVGVGSAASRAALAVVLLGAVGLGAALDGPRLEDAVLAHAPRALLGRVHLGAVLVEVLTDGAALLLERGCDKARLNEVLENVDLRKLL